MSEIDGAGGGRVCSMCREMKQNHDASFSRKQRVAQVLRRKCTGCVAGAIASALPQGAATGGGGNCSVLDAAPGVTGGAQDQIDSLIPATSSSKEPDDSASEYCQFCLHPVSCSCFSSPLPPALLSLHETLDKAEQFFERACLQVLAASEETRDFYLSPIQACNA